MFLDELNREHRGPHARMEVFGPDVRYQVQTEDRPLEGVSADMKDGESRGLDHVCIWRNTLDCLMEPMCMILREMLR